MRTKKPLPLTSGLAQAKTQLHNRQVKQSFAAKQCSERAKSIEQGIALFLFNAGGAFRFVGRRPTLLIHKAFSLNLMAMVYPHINPSDF